MARIYVASSWRNEYQPAVIKDLITAGHQAYDFRNPPYKTGFRWSDVEKDWQTWDRERYRELLCTSPIASHGFTADMRGLTWADTCLLVLPCGRSSHLEAGWAAGANKRLIVFIPEDIEPDLMYLMAGSICLTMTEVLEQLK
jgi:hypothetical protein